MTVYGFSDNLTSPVPICMPVMPNPNSEVSSRISLIDAAWKAEPGAERFS